MLKKVLAVVAGFIVWTVVWLATNAALPAIWPERFDADGIPIDGVVLAIAIAMSVVCSVLGGFVVARIVGAGGSRSVLVLAVLLLVVGIAVQMQYWTVMPLWYHLAFLALLVPATMMGGRLGTPAAGSA